MHRFKVRILLHSSLLLSLLLTSGCQGKKDPGIEDQIISENKTVVKGLLENGSDELIYFDEMGARAFYPIDTVRCNDKGEFLIRFRADHTAFYALRGEDQSYVTLLIEPGQKVEFRGSINSSHDYFVKGSPGSELIHKLAIEHKRTVAEMAQISRQNKMALRSPDYQEIKLKLDERFDSLATAFYDYSLNFIHENHQSLSILIALYNQYGYGLPVFNLKADPDIFHFVDSSLSKYYPENEAVKMLHSQLASANLSNNTAAQKSGLKTGDKAPDFVMTDFKGNPIALNDFKGNYVLLSFWAAWSRPSKDENEYLKKAFRMFHNKGFNILQVSLDENEQLWKQTIEADTLLWHHASDLRRWESKINDLYHLEKIPSNYLISPDGKIIGIDLFGEDLIQQLRKIFK